MSFALGQPVALQHVVRDGNGAPANAGTATLTVVRPDGTSETPTVANPPAVTGTYTASYLPAAPGLYAVYWVFGGANATAPPPDSIYVDARLPPLASLTEAREQCRVYSPDDDVLLQRYLRTASEHCERRTQVWRRQTLMTTRGGGRSTVRLRRPVIAVTAITEEGAAVAPSGWTLAAEEGLLYRGPSTSCGWRWSGGLGSVVVTYVAGVAAGIVPDPIRQGVLLLTEHLWNTQRGGGGGLPRNAGDSDWTLPAGFTLPNAVREQWEPWIPELAA